MEVGSRVSFVNLPRVKNDDFAISKVDNFALEFESGTCPRSSRIDGG